jgi:hypothetical protein
MKVVPSLPRTRKEYSLATALMNTCRADWSTAYIVGVHLKLVMQGGYRGVGPRYSTMFKPINADDESN